MDINENTITIGDLKHGQIGIVNWEDTDYEEYVIRVKDYFVILNNNDDFIDDHAEVLTRNYLTLKDRKCVLMNKDECVAINQRIYE